MMLDNKPNRFPLPKRRAAPAEARQDLRIRPDRDFRDFPQVQRRHLPCPVPIQKSLHQERRHFEPKKLELIKSVVRQKRLPQHRPVKPRGKAHVKWDGIAQEREVLRGDRRKKVEGVRGHSSTHSVEKMMGMKRRVERRESKRGGIPDKSLGDKPYSHVEYSENFFHNRGLIPQIQFSRTLNKNPGLQTLVAVNKNNGRTKVYSEVIAEQRHRNDVQGVENLPDIPCDGMDSD